MSFQPESCPFCGNKEIEPWWKDVWSCNECASYIEPDDIGRICECASCTIRRASGKP